MPIIDHNDSKPDQDGQRWAAVQRRDKSADGRFCYAVITTGIYCRPSCPSRQPLRKNVRFFASAEAAGAAGFRACRRCRPDAIDAPHPHQRMVLNACRRIETADNRPTLAELAGHAGMSPYHFQRVFKASVGLTPKQYEKAYRERRLREELRGSRTVTDALYQAGYGSSARFYADAPGSIGMPPGTRRARGKGETIRFAVGDCSLGAILVAATDRGVCAISVGNDAQQLLADLQADFSDATLIGGDHDFETVVANVVGLIEDPSRDCKLPLDIRGTAFQKKVWHALTSIRSGDTASYAQVARMIGRPGAARAVGRAISTNRLAVAIPCHRVVRADGSLSGYRWGVERKRALLEREARTRSHDNAG